MTRRLRPAVLGSAASLVGALLLCACASIAPEVAPPNPADAVELGAAHTAPAGAAGGRWVGTLAGLRADDERVATVAWRLQSANAALCPDVAPVTGLVLQDALQYSPRVRAAAVAAFHIGDLPSVEAVAADGPGARAGFKIGDQVVAVDGAPIPAPPPGADPGDQPADYAPLRAALLAIRSALSHGPAEVDVLRGGARLRLTLRPQAGCDYEIQVLPGPDLNASADGRHVFISSALVDFARSDDMLALVLGHELAHDVLRHHARLSQSDAAHRLLGDVASSPASLRLAEREADYVGLYLTARAGYAIADAPAFFASLPADSPFSWSHPSDAERTGALALTRDEIAAKEARGEPLTPNPAR